MQQITHIDNLKQPLIAVTVPEDAYNSTVFSKSCTLGFRTETKIFATQKIQLPIECTLLGEVLSNQEISFDIEEFLGESKILIAGSQKMAEIFKAANAKFTFISALTDAGVDFNYLAEKKLKLIILQKK